ncbi:MAG: hypothetical protein AAF085_06225 [Planctomycetota bacterium]
MTIRPSIKATRNTLLGIIGFLLIISATSYYVGLQAESDKLDRLSLYLNFNAEMSVPTYFSVLMLVASASLLSLIAFVRYKNRQPLRFYWPVLAAGFWFMSLDEYAGLHERLDGASKAVGLDEYLAWGWVVSGMIIVILTIAIFMPFLLKLPKATRYQFIVAGSVFVGGAVVIETLQSIYYGHAERTAAYFIYYTVEELFEMVGLVIFITALMQYIRDEIGELRFSVANQAVTESPAQDDVAQAREKHAVADRPEPHQTRQHSVV